MTTGIEKTDKTCPYIFLLPDLPGCASTFFAGIGVIFIEITMHPQYTDFRVLLLGWFISQRD